MAEEGTEEQPKKKRGRPKGTKKTSEKESVTTEKAEIAAAKAKKAAEKLEAAKEKAAQKEYEAAKAEAAPATPADVYTNKRGLDQIFRREMGEPEFWLDKSGRAPPRPILTADEELAISRKVEIPTNQIPQYNPEHILSPEFGGVSNYERGISDFKQELEEKLQRIKDNPETNTQEILQTQEDLKTLDYLYENFNIGMNVFRTAKGARKKLGE